MKSEQKKAHLKPYYLVGTVVGVYLFMIPVLLSVLKSNDPNLGIRVLLASIMMALLVPYIDRLIDSDDKSSQTN